MSAKRNNAVLIFGIAFVLLVSLAVTSPRTNAQQGQVWARVDVSSAISSRVDLVSVFMLDAGNAWAAGNENVAQNGLVYDMKFRDGRWSVAESNRFSAPLQQVVAISDDNVWVLAANGVFHKEGSTWHDLGSSLHLIAGDYLSTMQMFGTGGEGWIGGSRSSQHGSVPLFLHYQGGQWHRDDSIVTAGAIQSLHFAPGGSGYAVGGQFAYRYTGQHWEEMGDPCTQFVPCGYRLNGVRTMANGDAWAAGYSEHVTGGPPSPQVQTILHLSGDRWQQIIPGQAVPGPDGRNPRQTGLNGLSFSSDGVGLAVGWQSLTFPMGGPLPYIISYRPDRAWHYENLPYIEGGQLRAVSQADSTHALAVGWSGLILGYGYGGTEPGPWPTPTPFPTATPPSGPNPTDRVPDPHDPRFIYFPLVGHTLQGGFRDYWQRHGGLQQFGYPITEEFIEPDPFGRKPYTVQYFERARFEYHPENRPPYDVLLGLLGRTITQGRENEPTFRATAGQGPLYFRETGHNMAAQFAEYWRTHGGLPVYGYPISEPFNEVSPTDGKTYLVQYFERNRFEYHPELSEAYRVSLGLLGVQVAHSKGWLP